MSLNANQRPSNIKIGMTSLVCCYPFWWNKAGSVENSFNVLRASWTPLQKSSAVWSNSTQQNYWSSGLQLRQHTIWSISCSSYEQIYQTYHFPVLVEGKCRSLYVHFIHVVGLQLLLFVMKLPKLLSFVMNVVWSYKCMIAMLDNNWCHVYSMYITYTWTCKNSFPLTPAFVSSAWVADAADEPELHSLNLGFSYSHR